MEQLEAFSIMALEVGVSVCGLDKAREDGFTGQLLLLGERRGQKHRLLRLCRM